MKTQKPPRKTALCDKLCPTLALVALALSAGAGTFVLNLDVVPGVAPRVIVVDVLLDGMPGISVSHERDVTGNPNFYA